MKKFTHTLLAFGAFCATALISHAETAPKIVVVDMVKVYDTHYETVAENAKMKADTDKAQVSLDQLKKEQDDLVHQFNDLRDAANNPTATPDAKAKSTADAQKKYQELQAKGNEMQSFVTQTRATIQQRIQNFQSSLMEDITKVAVRIAATHNASLVLDKSARGGTIGLVLYADPSYDITSEVMDDIAKNKPAAPPPVAPDASMPMPAGPSPAPASSSDTPPSITVPAVK